MISSIEEIQCKECGACKALKPLIEYHANKDSKDGRYSICKICVAQRHIQKRQANPYVKQKMEQKAYDEETRSKVCPKCEKRKTWEEYGFNGTLKSGKKRLKTWCIECVNKNSAEWGRAHPERRKAAQDKYSAGHQETIKARAKAYGPKRWRAIIKRKYGISKDDIDKLIALQGGRCKCCNRKFHGNGKRRPVVDHCHGKSGHVRGIICAGCNISEGMMETPHAVLNIYEYMMNNELLSYQAGEN